MKTANLSLSLVLATLASCQSNVAYRDALSFSFLPPKVCEHNVSALSEGIGYSSGFGQSPIMDAGGMQKRQSCPAGYGLCQSLYH